MTHTVTLSADQAPKETAARRRHTIGERTEESLRFHGTRRREVEAPVAAARARTRLATDEATGLALREATAPRERDRRRPR